MSRYFEPKSIAKLKERLLPGEKAVVVTHLNPDGDAVGAATAVAHWLRSCSMEPQVIIPDRYPSFLSFMDSNEEVLFFESSRERATQLIDNATLIVMVDFNQLSRSGDMEPTIAASSAYKVLIDHHIEPKREEFDLLIHSSEVSSTCELLYWLLREMGVEIGLSLANSLYIGMMTDTNNFNNSVTSDTLLMASHLLSLGVDKELFQKRIFASFSQERMRLMGHLLLNRFTLLENYRLGYLTLSLEDQLKFNYRKGDSEGFVNLPLRIEEVDIAILFTQLHNSIRVSLRSKEGYSVNDLAIRHFNGGGHKMAAGGTLYIPFGDIDRFLLDSLKESYKICRDE
ncbi:MAG: bifunctional oligoribonuclease/PAP phosphatase NrnA [Bacteroidales bacterium]